MLPLNNQLPPSVPTTLSSPTPVSDKANNHIELNQDPLNPQIQQQISNFLQGMKPPPSLNAMRDQVPDNVWKNSDGVASRELSALLNTPIGKEMSQELQNRFGSSTFNALTWGMAGLASMMVDQSQGASTYSIEGFDWGAGDDNPANTLGHLKQFLVEQEQTTPELAGAVAYVQLWKFSPASLLRNIPPYANKTSLEWEKVSNKVDELMSKHPLQTLSMTYDDVLDLIDPTRVEKRVTEF
ncbi:hypothetical protein [Pseudomonas sp. Marseille-Q1929]|uniref:hypothetical protein n=1 Tax=Pseudomonas sp. Marseille-Q1929 TaxID=2730402 RepID=UPI001A8F54EA|nr:hypothetical protein [Pseudomonas sp. Marseille-Q1929]MBO0492986.1 hypothetical protein [Pseudomonas sp. Marseille-Q1929]